jgi:hypothetical protein
LLLFLIVRDEEYLRKFILPEREKHVIVFALSSPSQLSEEFSPCTDGGQHCTISCKLAMKSTI